jgi:hypothetical protein
MLVGSRRFLVSSFALLALTFLSAARGLAGDASQLDLAPDAGAVR